METLILGWYILVETQSVLLLTLFASLQYIGTLLAPMFGVVSNRVGTRNLLCAMRGFYAVLAATLMTFTFLGVLGPVHVFVIAGLMGIVRHSDLVMRYALIGETMPTDHLMSATSVSRITQDSARIIGALAGAGLVAALGMGAAYVVITGFYLTSLTLTLRVAGKPAAAVAADGSTVKRSSPWRDLKDGMAYVWNTPQLLAAMYLAFLVNLSAFPLMMGLLPYVAKEIYGMDQTGLGMLVASGACGALLSSLALSRMGHVVRPGRMIVVFCIVWYLTLLVFAQVTHPQTGIAVLVLVGLAQGLCMLPMSVMLLRTADERFRSRVMGIRMLAVYGVPVGLLVAGPMITRFGYPLTATAYSLFGLLFTFIIAVRWRSHLWAADAPANRR